MQTLFEVGFVLALILPPAAVAAGTCAALAAPLGVRRYPTSPARMPETGHRLFVRRAP